MEGEGRPNPARFEEAGRRPNGASKEALLLRDRLGDSLAASAAATPESRERHHETTLASHRATKMLAASDRKALRHWYSEELQPRLSR